MTFTARDWICLAIAILAGILGLFEVLNADDVLKAWLVVLGYLFGRGEAVAVARLRR